MRFSEYLKTTTSVAILLTSVIGTPLPSPGDLVAEAHANLEDLVAIVGSSAEASTSPSITPKSHREQCLRKVDEYKTTFQLRTGGPVDAGLLEDLEDECNQKSDHEPITSPLGPRKLGFALEPVAIAGRIALQREDQIQRCLERAKRVRHVDTSSPEEKKNIRRACAQLPPQKRTFEDSDKELAKDKREQLLQDTQILSNASVSYGAGSQSERDAQIGRCLVRFEKTLGRPLDEALKTEARTTCEMLPPPEYPSEDLSNSSTKQKRDPVVEEDEEVSTLSLLSQAVQLLTGQTGMVKSAISPLVACLFNYLVVVNPKNLHFINQAEKEDAVTYCLTGKQEFGPQRWQGVSPNIEFQKGSPPPAVQPRVDGYEGKDEDVSSRKVSIDCPM